MRRQQNNESDEEEYIHSEPSIERVLISSPSPPTSAEGKRFSSPSALKDLESDLEETNANVIVLENQNTLIEEVKPLVQAKHDEIPYKFEIINDGDHHKPLLSRENHLQLHSSTLKPINFATGVLIQTWCRHQYLKGLLPTLMVIWYLGVTFLAIQYEHDSALFLREETQKHNCTEILKERLYFYPLDCSSVHRSKQYYSLDDDLSLWRLSFNCTVPNAHFYYNEDYWGVQRYNAIVGIIANFLLPLIFTYFVYEACYLALYDCLVIIPGLDETTNEPILRYADGPYRVSWFVLRDLYYRCIVGTRSGKAEQQQEMTSFQLGIDEEGEEMGLLSQENSRKKSLMKRNTYEMMLIPRKWPGIRLGYMASLCINLFVVLTATTASSFLATNGNVCRCTDESDYSINRATAGTFAVLSLYLAAVLIPSLKYYYRLFLCIKDIEVLASSKYSNEFTIRRHGGIRNLFDLIPALCMPLLPNVAYYLLWVIPMSLVYVVMKMFLYLISHYGMNIDKKPFESFYRLHVFNLNDRWWCSWLIRSIHEDELEGWAPLVPDDH
eukprot:gene10100-10979_t